MHVQNLIGMEDYAVLRNYFESLKSLPALLVHPSTPSFSSIKKYKGVGIYDKCYEIISQCIHNDLPVHSMNDLLDHAYYLGEDKPIDNMVFGACNEQMQELMIMQQSIFGDYFPYKLRKNHLRNSLAFTRYSGNEFLEYVIKHMRKV